MAVALLATNYTQAQENACKRCVRRSHPARWIGPGRKARAAAAGTAVRRRVQHTAGRCRAAPGGYSAAATAIVPAALIFALLRKGASVRPLRAGSFAVLAASGLGCLTLRLSEANDSLVHLVDWHYLPTLLFAVIGALVGRYLLRW